MLGLQSQMYSNRSVFMKNIVLVVGVCASLLACTTKTNTSQDTSQAPPSDMAYIQANKLNERQNEVLLWSQDERAVGFRNLDKLFFTRGIRKSPQASPIEEAPVDLSTFSYEVDGKQYTLNDFVNLPSAKGVVVLKDGKLVAESYSSEHSKDVIWVSFSVTKSITSMLVGAAIKDGYINSIDDLVVDYLPQLKGSAYDGVTIKNVLTMSSGVQWNEDYADPNSDVSRAGSANGMVLLNYLKQLPRAHAPGTTFNYNTAESNLIGELLRSAVGNNASSYLQEKIWQPFGMQSDAVWLIDRPNGVETGGCCITATLRDYALLGQFALNELKQPDVLPENWMQDSITPSASFPRYGYQWWLDQNGQFFAASGIFGQSILVIPELDLVIAKHANTPKATGRSEYSTHSQALNSALIKFLAQ